MREIGEIKWFGGYNQKRHALIDYGYILRNSKPDIYVNKVHLHCKVKDLRPSVIVTFEVGVNYKNAMEQAIKVKLIEDEKDEECLIYGITCNDERYFVPSVDVFFANFEGEKIANFWNKLQDKFKIMLLYKIASKGIPTYILESLNEKNKLIRAMLLILWSKQYEDKMNVAYEKAFILIKEYIEKKSEKVNIFEKNENYKVDTKKPWSEWTFLEFLESCSKVTVLEDIKSGNKALLKIINLIMKM